jgi:hypothetical protein
MMVYVTFWISPSGFALGPNVTLLSEETTRIEETSLKLHEGQTPYDPELLYSNTVEYAGKETELLKKFPYVTQILSIEPLVATSTDIGFDESYPKKVPQDGKD